jgi:hypothetical protein
VQTLLRKYDIHGPSDLVQTLGIDRRYAWMLWRGRRKFSLAHAVALNRRKRVPIPALFEAVPDPPEAQEPLPRGRPKGQRKKQPPEGGASV